MEHEVQDPKTQEPHPKKHTRSRGEGVQGHERLNRERQLVPLSLHPIPKTQSRRHTPPQPHTWRPPPRTLSNPLPPPPPEERVPNKTTPLSRSEPCNNAFDNTYYPCLFPEPDTDELDFEDLQGKLDREKKYNETVKQLRKFQSYTKQVGTSYDDIQPIMSDAQWDRSQAIATRLNKGIHKDLERLRMFIDIIDVDEFIKALCDKRSNIIICSDGSNNRTYAQASCGWVIAIRGSPCPRPNLIDKCSPSYLPPPPQ